RPPRSPPAEAAASRGSKRNAPAVRPEPEGCEKPLGEGLGVRVRQGIQRAAGITALALLALAVAGCSTPTPPKPPEEALQRPEWRVGDRWVFRRMPTSQMGGVTSLVTHEVIEATPDGYAMRIRQLNEEFTRYWTRDFHLSHQESRGRPLNRFEPPARYFE